MRPKQVARMGVDALTAQEWYLQYGDESHVRREIVSLALLVGERGCGHLAYMAKGLGVPSLLIGPWFAPQKP